MLDVAEIIFQTCKTYLLQQGKFLLMLFVLIAVAISYYLVGFGGADEYRVHRPNRSGTQLYPAEDKKIPDDVLDQAGAAERRKSSDGKERRSSRRLQGPA